MSARIVLLPMLLLASCAADPAVTPDGGDTNVAAATKAAVDDTDAALRDAGPQGTK